MTRSQKTATATQERRRRYRAGHVSELIAAVYLIVTGHAILARRYRTPAGEFDIVAVKGRRLAFIEVKRRRTLEEAQASVGAHQARRIKEACDLWLSRNARYREHEISFDLIFVLPWTLPRHLQNAL